MQWLKANDKENLTLKNTIESLVVVETFGTPSRSKVLTFFILKQQHSAENVSAERSIL